MEGALEALPHSRHHFGDAEHIWEHAKNLEAQRKTQTLYNSCFFLPPSHLVHNYFQSARTSLKRPRQPMWRRPGFGPSMLRYFDPATGSWLNPAVREWRIQSCFSHACRWRYIGYCMIMYVYMCSLSLYVYIYIIIYINLDRLYGYAWVQVLFAVFWTFQNISRRYRHLGLGVGGWGVGEMSCVCDVRMWTDFCLVLFLHFV